MRNLIAFGFFLLCCSAIGQDMPANIAKKFNDYRSKHQTLKTLVSFSQDKYVPGDTAFFHAWFFTEAGQPIGGDQILNMDMVDGNGKVVTSMMFRVKDGVGENQVIIPSSISQGVYVMSVYSEAMKGADAEYAFRKPITIVRQNEIAAEFANRVVTSEHIRVDTTSKDFINITVTFTDRKDKDLTLVLTSDGQLHSTAQFDLRKRNAVNIRLPRKDFPLGWSQVSVIDKEGAVLATHQFYLPFNIRCEIELNKTSFRNGETVSGGVKVFDVDGTQLSVPVSITVLNDNLPVGSSEKFQPVAPPLVPWENILSGNIPAPRKPSRLITISGTAYHSQTNEPVQRETIINAFMKKNHFGFEAGVEDNGKFEIVFSDFFENDEMFYYAECDQNEIPDVKIRWDVEPIAHQPAPRSRVISGADNYARFIEKKRTVDRSYNYFLGDTTKLKSPTPSLDKLFERDGDVINLRDYKIFPTMEEMVLEVIPRLRKVIGKNELRVNLSEVNLKSLGGPVFVIDNAITKDPDAFLSLNPTEVVSIRVIYRTKDLQKYLPVSRNGVVVVTTKNAAKRKINENVVPVSGLSAPLRFVPVRDTRPEFRSTLYWGLLRTDASKTKSFDFTTSQDVGKMKIRVTGVFGGQVFTAERGINVTFK